MEGSSDTGTLVADTEHRWINTVEIKLKYYFMQKSWCAKNIFLSASSFYRETLNLTCWGVTC